MRGSSKPTYSTKRAGKWYLWRTACETELVETFLHVARSEPKIRPEEIDEGRWFTLDEAAALVASGAATPNLAEELRRVREAGVLEQV